MGVMAFDKGLSLSIGPKPDDYSDGLIEEIEGLIKVYKSRHVERSLIVPSVGPSLDLELDVTVRDVIIDKLTNIWARVYVPKCNDDHKLPLLVYFHGGGFCLGSAAWKCYHDFLGTLSSQLQCLIVSVNYRLAPENPLPAAYEDGIKALIWLKQEANSPSSEWWTRHCNFSSTFLAGDSAGANLAYNVALNLGTHQIGLLTPLIIKGIILIQPFMGGEERTNSEKTMAQSRRSTLRLAASDTYWWLALPLGANRDHPWCNPLGGDSRKLLRDLRLMVCIAEEDILRDRNLELCSILTSVGNKVEYLISQGMGHAFQVLDKSQISQTRRQEMISHIMNFIYE